MARPMLMLRSMSRRGGFDRRHVLQQGVGRPPAATAGATVSAARGSAGRQSSPVSRQATASLYRRLSSSHNWMARSAGAAGSLASRRLAVVSAGSQVVARPRRGAARRRRCAAWPRSPSWIQSNSVAAQSSSRHASGSSRARARRALPSAARAACAGRRGRPPPTILQQRPTSSSSRPGLEADLLAAGQDGRQHALGAGGQQEDDRVAAAVPPGS